MITFSSTLVIARKTTRNFTSLEISKSNLKVEQRGCMVWRFVAKISSVRTLCGGNFFPITFAPPFLSRIPLDDGSRDSFVRSLPLVKSATILEETSALACQARRDTWYLYNLYDTDKCDCSVTVRLVGCTRRKANLTAPHSALR